MRKHVAMLKHVLIVFIVDQCNASYCQEIVHFIGSLLESITDSIQASHVTVIESGLAYVLLDVIHVFTSDREVTEVRFHYCMA